MDRVQNPGTAFSLDILTRMIAKMTKALLTVYILDPHSPVTLEKLRHHMPGRAHEINYSLAKDVLNYTNLNPEDAWFVFPDKGAAQRYNYEEYPNVIICEKVRDFATGKIEDIKAHIHKETKRPKENSPIIIIDDLCSYGGTFVGTIEAIKTDLGIKSENNWLIVTHAEEAIDMGQVPVTFSKIFSTDSIAIPQGHTNMSISEYDESKKVYIRPVLDIIQDIN